MNKDSFSISAKVTCFIAVLTLFAGCGSDSGTSKLKASDSGGNSYPSDVRDNFVTSCATNAGITSGSDAADFEDSCLCILEKIEDRYSLKEFTEADARILSGEDSNIDFVELAQGCV